ncbi:MAG: tetratricopeptide repeat protein [Chthoniobacterales bacterium]|nr:tetratricopeptide repeat protein [Chthoniobacterales bacterium]
MLLHIFILTLATQVQELPSVPEVRRAIPVSSESTSREIPRAPEVEMSQDIRLAPVKSLDPQQLSNDQLEIADRSFNRSEFSLAAAEYKKFLLMTSPGQLRRDQALFRLGECYRKVENNVAAEEIYQQLLKEFSSGVFAAGAAYRLGEYYQKQREIPKAIVAFEKVDLFCNDPKIKNSALYELALCYDQVGNDKKALEIFNHVAHEEGPNRVVAQMAVAQHEEKLGHYDKALELYQSVGKENSEKVAAEAFVKAGMVAYQAEKKEEASHLFSQAASLSNPGDWGSIAALALMKVAYEKKDYPLVLKNSDQAIDTPNAEGKTQALFLTAQAERQLGDFKKALSFYDRVIAEAPTSGSAMEASFIRLLVLHSLKDSTLLMQLELFLKNTTNGSQKIQAQLLKAEVLFESANYKAAAEAYDALQNSVLSTDLKSDTLYKEAWAWNQAGNTKQALLILSQWIGAFPQSPEIPTALIQRAMLEQKSNNEKDAITDYETLITKYPKAPERELALQQKALLHGQLQDNKQMVITFQQLLQEYPQTTAAAQAHFWIGWSSFESKEYSAAIPFLEKARLLDCKEFGERATLRLLLAHYYLQQFNETLHEAETLPRGAVPLAVAQWMGLNAFDLGKIPQAEKWLSLVAKSNNSDLITDELELALAKTLLQEKKLHEAIDPATKALELSRDPQSRAEAMLTLATLQKGLKNYSQANTLVQETLLLQPEGNINMKARLLFGDLLFAQQDYDGAARAYRAITLLTQDNGLLKQALRQAAEAYRNANNSVEAQKAMEEYARVDSKK